jgi:hypothetical protein
MDDDVTEVLNARVEGGEIGTCTVREYLVTLLETLWIEKDEFTGKRPFGNSGWEYDLYGALVAAGIVPGTFDEDGYLYEFLYEDYQRANKLIAEAIISLR